MGWEAVGHRKPVAAVVGAGVRTRHGLLQGLEIQAMSDTEAAPRAASEPSGCCRRRGLGVGAWRHRPGAASLPASAGLASATAGCAPSPRTLLDVRGPGVQSWAPWPAPAPGHRAGSRTWRVPEQASEAPQAPGALPGRLTSHPDAVLLAGQGPTRPSVFITHLARGGPNLCLTVCHLEMISERCSEGRHLFAVSSLPWVWEDLQSRR